MPLLLGTACHRGSINLKAAWSHSAKNGVHKDNTMSQNRQKNASVFHWTASRPRFTQPEASINKILFCSTFLTESMHITVKKACMCMPVHMYTYVYSWFLNDLPSNLLKNGLANLKI